MKRILSAIGAGFLVFMAIAGPVYAYVKSDDTIIVDADEVIDDDFFAGGNEVIIRGTINGDVYVGASRLEVRGTVNGDVIAGANTVIVTGKIRDDLRVGANSITLVGAEIGDSVSVGGNELSIDEDTVIGGGLLFGGRLLSLDGTVGRGVMTGNQTTRVDGEVGKTIRVAAQSITIGKNALIKGNLEYNSDNEAVVNGTILGETIRSEGINVSTEGMLRWLVTALNVWAYFAAILIGGVLILVFPKMFKKADDNFKKKVWPSIGWGALWVFASLPLAMLLMVTVVGIPLALIVVLLWILTVLFAKFFVGYTVGSSVLRYVKKNQKNYNPSVFWALVLGLSLYYLLRVVPYVGVFVRLATTVVGIALMLTLYSRPQKAKSN